MLNKSYEIITWNFTAVRNGGVYEENCIDF